LVRNNVISQNELNEGKNVIYGIGQGNNMAETFNYTQFESGLDISFLYQSIGNNMVPYKNNSSNNFGNNNVNNNNIDNNYDEQFNVMNMNMNMDINNF
jgi:hypothetical protein